MKKLFIPIILFTIITGCKKTGDNIDSSIFESTPTSSPIVPGTIDEASGIADSKLNAGNLWVENDGNNTNDIFIVSHEGQLKKRMAINAVNRDWEDIAIANGPVANTNYIYLADIGDNFLRNTTYYIYRFPEPAITTDTVFTIDKISFQYPDGFHDAEAILIDNITKDIYIITKRDTKSRLYKLSYPQSTTAATTATFISELPFSMATSAAMSPDGSEILIKTYTNIYYWKRSLTQSIETTVAQPYKTLGYKLELQGEAICFKNDNSGFFTLSEKPASAASVALDFYKRK